MLSCFHDTLGLINHCKALCGCYGRKQAEALPGISPAGSLQLDSRGWHQYATLGYAAFMEQRLRRSGFANFDLWSEISSCIEGWRLSSSCVYGEMFLENKNHLDMSQSMCRWSIMHIKSLFCVLVWVLKWTTTWSVGARQLAETVKNIINDPPSVI